MDTGVFAFASSSNSESFTPVKRRESTINNRQYHVDSEKDWTTARCHRLLRALTSRVAVLKKEISRYAQPGKDAATNQAPGAQSTVTKADDGDWPQTRKRIRTTYSSRRTKIGNGTQAGSSGLRGARAKKDRRSFVPGEIPVSTPLLARAIGDQADRPAPVNAIPIADGLAVIKGKRRGTRYGIGITEGDFQLTKPLREIRENIPAIRYTTYEGIYNGVEALLRSTKADEVDTKKRGARSLSSMALRAVPHYIHEQEALLEVHMHETGSRSAIQSRDIATEIYDELEEFGISGYGWPQLKTVVRAHGIKVLLDAIHAGLMDIDFCGALISLCIHTNSMDEGRLLLSALVTSERYPTPVALYDPFKQSIHLLCKFAQYTGQSCFQFRQLSCIIASKTLPVEWLATKGFGPIWAQALQAPRVGIDNGDSLAFLEASMSALTFHRLQTKTAPTGGSGMAEAVGNTFFSLLTTFLSIILISKESDGDLDTVYQITQRHIQFATLLRNSLSGYKVGSKADASKSILPLLANLFMDHEEVDVWGPDSHMGQLLLTHLSRHYDNLTSISSPYPEAVMFICQVARCCGRGASTSGFEYLEHLHVILEGLLQDKSGSSVLMGLIVDSAFAFAQKVPDRSYLDYAANLDAKYCSRGFDTDASLHSISTSDDDTENSGFRWEEGIGEWVTATPAAINSKRKFDSEQLSEDELECDTPYRPPPNLRRKVEGAPTPPAVNRDNQDDNSVVETHSETAESPDLQFDRSEIERSFDLEQSAVELSPSSGSDDELAGASLRSPISHTSEQIESEDELADSSLQSINSSMVEETEDEMEFSFAEESLGSIELPSMLESTSHSNHRISIYRAPRLNRKIFRQSDDFQIFDESFVSTTSSVSSNFSNESSGPRRELIDRVPRLGRKALQTSQTFRLFDESDDELSILSVSSQEHQALQDVTRSSITNAQPPRQAKTALTQSKSKAMRKRFTAHLSDSEDELCI